MPKQERKPRPILVINRHSGLHFRRKAIAELFHFLDRQEDFDAPSGELSIAFLSETELSGVHETYLRDSSPTDVITFPGDSDMDCAGEICVSVDYAENSSRARGLPVSKELTLYLIHGWLHLCGLDDKDEALQKLMRAAEKELLARVLDAGVLPSFKPRKSARLGQH